MQLPILRYDGPIHLVKTEADLQRASHDIQHEHVVGFDTETRPTFKKGQSHAPALVQIAASRAVYLFQLSHMDFSHALTELFGNPKLIKAGIALDRDLVDLRKLFMFEAKNFLDLSDVAKHRGLKQSGVRNLAGLFLEGRITKSMQTSNWAQPRLSEKQMRYAATDAWVCRELYLHFEQRGFLKDLPPSKPPPKPARG